MLGHTVKKLKFIFVACCLTAMSNVYAEKTISMHETANKGVGKAVGKIVISETKYGLLFTPDLQGLTPGVHGFHLHELASCDDNGMAAGGHFDPKKTGKHLGPYNDKGHMGDLPALYVNADGSANLPVVAPRLKHLSELKSHTLMIHTGGDNYSDVPEKLGGGGGRMICGVVA